MQSVHMLVCACMYVNVCACACVHLCLSVCVLIHICPCMCLDVSESGERGAGSQSAVAPLVPVLVAMPLRAVKVKVTTGLATVLPARFLTLILAFPWRPRTPDRASHPPNHFHISHAMLQLSRDPARPSLLCRVVSPPLVFISGKPVWLP